MAAGSVKTVNSKIVGILGGMTYKSTVTYYTKITEGINKLLPCKYGKRSAKTLIYSLDMEEFTELVLNEENKQNYNDSMLESIERLKNGGADFYIMACNTSHDSLSFIEQYIPYSMFPYLHIADCCAYKLKQNDISRVGLIGTKTTMQNEDVYIQRLADHGIEVVVPQSITHQDEIERIIYDELCVGVYDNIISKEFLVKDVIKNDLCLNQNAEGCILACSEFETIIKPNEIQDVEIVDSAQAHIDATIDVLVDAFSGSDFLP